MPRQLISKAIQVDQISLEHCDWYSQDAASGSNTGALKLPRGNTGERPATHTGGRENIEIQLTVSQPDVYSSDSNFLQMDPWMWGWEGNYNRNALTSTTVTSGNAVPGLTLLRGSKYRFKNNTVGHNLWLRSAEKTDSNDPNNIYALGSNEGVTNNGAIKAQPSDASAEVEWVIPSNYAPSVVYVQHNQTGMVNTIAIADPPNETLGYMRLNTDIGHDAATKTGLEVYTGTGWKTIPFEDNAGGTKTHPTGTLLTDDNGGVATSAASTSDNASIATATATTEDFGELLVTAFLPDGDLSATVTGVGATKTLVLHDGSTGGGVPMLRADMANAPIKKTNKSIQYLRDGNGVTYTQTNVDGSEVSRIAFIEETAGHDVFALEDSGKKLRVSGNINSNTWFKITFDAYTNTDQMYLDFRKNGTRVTHRWTTTSSDHHSFTVFIQMSFNDILEVHANSIGAQNTAYLSDKHMLIELVGS
jgi:hypothetical protein